MAEFIHLLYVDDNPLDRELVREVLKRTPGNFQITEAGSRQEFETLLAQDQYDLVLSDFDILGFNGLQVLDLVHAKDPELPVVIVTGTGSEEIAVAALKLGAADYVIKSLHHLQRLPSIIQQVLHQKRQAAGRQQAEQQFHFQATILQNVQDSVIVTDLEGRIIYWNEGATAIFGYTAAETLGRSILSLNPSQDSEREAAYLQTILAGQPYVGEWQGRRKDDSPVWLQVRTTLMRSVQGEVIGFIGVSKEISERKQAEEALRQLTAQLQGLAQASAVINASLSIPKILEAVTEQAQTIIGAHQAGISLTQGEHWGQVIQHISLSDKYAAWQDYKAKPDGSGIYALVCQTNRPMRLTQAELEAHPAWRGFGQAASQHPPLRGWLAVPLVEREGRNMGLIQLSDKYEGDFTMDDEIILVQLAQVAEVALENARLLAAERAAQEQLRNLTGYLHAVREDERAEIAREIHDELGQALTALKMDLAWLTKKLPDEPAIRQRAGAASQLINSTIRTMQHIAAELRPGLLDDLGLVPALEWQAQQFSERTGLDCGLVVANPEASLGRERDTVIFRIFQETLTNVTRHAGATRVEATLKDQPEGLTLTVRDNGRGISKAQLAAPTSLGLLGMRERARAWDGKLTFTGRPGLGTTVTLFLPRPAQEAACD